VRIAYLDDSGTGDLAVDPYAVMAGVIVTADLQWKAIDDYLRAMAENSSRVTGDFSSTRRMSGMDPVSFLAIDFRTSGREGCWSSVSLPRNSISQWFSVR
jgi:hypothetical protein